MDQETDRIKRHIDSEREQLGRNLDEIQYRMKKATDVKAHFNKNTGLILGGAVAAGFVLGLASRKSETSTSTSTSTWKSASNERTSERNVNAPSKKSALAAHLNRFTETLDDVLDGVVGGLAGVVAGKVQSMVSNAVPGFREQFDLIERQRGRSPVTQARPRASAE